jgi:outer membrane protein OmpA-like peptidoglycan-associated protein
MRLFQTATALPLIASLAALSVLASPTARAQTPLSAVSVDDLVRTLGGPGKKSFARTAPPDAASSLCSGQASPPAQAATGGSTGAGKRNLEVVPYAGDTTPGVNLQVQFAYSSDKLTDGDRALLDTLAKALQHRDLSADRFAVAGHTDTTGDARINLELSCARALAVRRYLVGKGVAEQRLSAYGFGSKRLLADQSPTDGVHRRVEVRKAPE